MTERFFVEFLLENVFFFFFGIGDPDHIFVVVRYWIENMIVVIYYNMLEGYYIKAKAGL